MLKTFILLTTIIAVAFCNAQVRIGYNAGSVNGAAVLELSNNVSAAPATWGSFIPPKVNFANPVFTSNYIWGIAGTPTEGAIVYNTSDSYANGFTGIGLYCWQRNCW